MYMKVVVAIMLMGSMLFAPLTLSQPTVQEIPKPTVIIESTINSTDVVEDTIEIQTPKPIIVPKFRLCTYMPNLSEEKINGQIIKLQNYIDYLSKHNLPEQSEAYFITQEEIMRVNYILNQYHSDLEILAQQKSEFPVSTKIWKFMKEELNWSNEVCAGVMGNIMVESGGHTLDIQWNIYDPDGAYYGICQWSKYYCPEVMNMTLEQQLLYLKNNVEETFNYWGKNYQIGFTYKDFIAMTDVQQVALAFAMCYERCNPIHYNVRTITALEAYEYYAK